MGVAPGRAGWLSSGLYKHDVDREAFPSADSCKGEDYRLGRMGGSRAALPSHMLLTCFAEHPGAEAMWTRLGFSRFTISTQ